MIRSIRKFLLINLLLSIFITTALTVIGNYILDQKDIQHHLDSLLSQAGLSFQALIGDNVDERHLRRIQLQLNTVPSLARQHHLDIDNPFAYNYEDKFQFQVWAKTGELLMHSANAPIEPLSDFEEGFSVVKIHKQPWRVFTTINPTTDLVIVMAERYDIRSELGRRIARDDIYIMVLVTPLLGLLIWIIIGKGLYPLQRIAREVSNRAATYLEPVDLTVVPQEISPLIDELNSLFHRLQQAFEREKRFSADAAHELKTPLAVLKTQAQVALRASSDDAKDDALKKLISAVDRSTHVVQQLLTLARMVPDYGYKAEDIALINLNKIAIDVISAIAPSAIEKEIEISLICSDQELSIYGNAIAIGILLRNLIDNAVRYSPENSQVEVKIDKVYDKVHIQVIDQGPGIPNELRSRVFERFYRIIGSTAKGSGLGLAIVSQIVQLHNAEIYLGTSELGKGLTVTIIFPREKIKVMNPP